MSRLRLSGQRSGRLFKRKFFGGLLHKMTDHPSASRGYNLSTCVHSATGQNPDREYADFSYVILMADIVAFKHLARRNNIKLKLIFFGCHSQRGRGLSQVQKNKKYERKTSCFLALSSMFAYNIYIYCSSMFFDTKFPRVYTSYNLS